jgi:ketosteroid isomerase-like protein
VWSSSGIAPRPSKPWGCGSRDSVALRQKQHYRASRAGSERDTGYAMSGENNVSPETEDVLRRSFEAFNERGFSGAMEFWHPDIVWHTDPLVPEPGVYTGFDAVRSYLDGFINAFGAWHIELHEIVDLDGHEVLCQITVSGHPLGQTDQETNLLNWAWIASVHDGKIDRIRSFFDQEKAFEAAGLRKQN